MGYKETPIGKIPKEWEVVRLGDTNVSEIRKNKVVSNVQKVAFIPMELIPDSSIYAKYEIRDLKDVKSSTYCEAGDLLLAKITPSLENGKQGIVPEEVPNGIALATTEVFSIVCKGIDKLFLFYLLKFPKFRKVLEYSMRGSTGRQRVPKEAVENLIVPFPPLSEQKKIAEILSTVDKAIELTDEIIAQTELLKKGLMQRLLTKGIGHEEFKFSKELGCEIPKEWEVVKLESISNEIKYGVTASVTSELGVPVLRVTDINDNGYFDPNSLLCADLRDNDIDKYRLKIGDLVIARSGATAGKVAVYEGSPKILCFASYLIKVSPKDSVFSKFLFYFLNSEIGKNQLFSGKRGSAQPNINSQTIKRIKIPLPSLPEQQKIAQILSTIDKKLELERERKQQLQELKKGLMQVLLTGKVRVRI